MNGSAGGSEPGESLAENRAGDRAEDLAAAEQRVAEVEDERSPLARQALALIEEAFPPHDRHPTYLLQQELEEKRRGLLLAYNYHMLALLLDERVIAVIIGRYLAELNAGFITYLAVHPRFRGLRLGGRIRARLVEAFRDDARANGHPDLAWILGEVQLESPWLRTLVEQRRAIPFDLTYYHPGLEPGDPERYVLYRQPIADVRPELPAAEVRKLVFAVWRRGYRVAYPLQRPAFRAMIEELEQKETVGAHPEVG